MSQEQIERITALATDRAAKMRAVESATFELRVAVINAIESGQLSEHKISREAGISRTTIRAWMGKAP